MMVNFSGVLAMFYPNNILHAIASNAEPGIPYNMYDDGFAKWRSYKAFVKRQIEFDYF